MRMVFGVLSLLVVLAILGSVAKRQLQALSAPVMSRPGAASAARSPTTPAETSRQLQRQVTDDVQRALQQGSQRNESTHP